MSFPTSPAKNRIRKGKILKLIFYLFFKFFSLTKFDRLIEPFVQRSFPDSSRKGSTVTIPLDHGTEDSDEQQQQQTPMGFVTEAELNAQQQRTWRQLRIAELLRRYSSGSDLIVV
jgi:hypothetical protein